MNIEDLGDPDLVIERLKIWIHGRQFPEANDYWDGNWLRITAYCSSGGSRVFAQGPILHLGEIEAFINELKGLNVSDRKTANLNCTEPNLAVRLEKVDNLGHINASVELTGDHMMEKHLFHFQIDLTYLPGIIKAGEKVLGKFPTRDKKH